MKEYLTIGEGRNLDIKVILNDTEVRYEGRIEDAPEEIKKLKYSKLDTGSVMVYYVYI